MGLRRDELPGYRDGSDPFLPAKETMQKKKRFDRLRAAALSGSPSSVSPDGTLDFCGMFPVGG